MEGNQMRVMRVMAGNFPTNVNKVSKEKIQVNVYGLNSPRHHPHHPQAIKLHGSSLALPCAGNSGRIFFLESGLQT